MTAEQEKIIEDYYLARREPLLEYAVGKLHDFHQAAELVQQIFEVACRKPEDLITSPNPYGWLTKVGAMLLRNNQRRRKVEQRLFALDLEEYRPDLFAAPPDHLSLRLTFGELVDTKEFELIYLMEVMGYTLAEIAKKKNITEAACKKRAERARKYLQKKL